MGASQPSVFNCQEWTDAGDPLALGRLYTYVPSTTTLKIAYTDPAGTIPHAYTYDSSGGQYIALDARGELPASLFLTSGGYDLTLRRPDGSTVWTRRAYGVDAELDLSDGSSRVGFIQSGSGAVSRTAEDKLRERVSILDFIPVSEHAAIRAGTSTYDCSAALQSAIASVTSGGWFYPAGTGIYFPPGNYYFASTIALKKRVRLYGDGSGQPSGEQVILTFPEGTVGIIVHRYNTIGIGVESPATTGADGSIIEGLKLQGGGGTAAHGIWLRARATLCRVQIDGFSGSGIAVIAGSGAGGVNEGNANGWRIDGARITNCGQHGIYTIGADSNAGLCIGADIANCGGNGILDSSFLGNTYVAPQTAGCVGAPYKTTNVNASNVFLNPYSEVGQPQSSVIAPSMVMWGSGTTNSGNGVSVASTNIGRLLAQQGIATETIEIRDGASPASGVGITMHDTSGGFSWTWERELGRWGWKWANLGSPGFLTFYDRNATVANGYARDLSAASGALGISAHYVGSASQMKLRDFGDAAPTSGDYLRGDIRTRLNPSAGGKAGIVCTTGGVAGSTAVFKDFGAIDA